jgi:hypothetical protein
MRAMKTICSRLRNDVRMNGASRMTLPRLAVPAVSALALALSLTACENVPTYKQPSLIRVIDASYAAPAVNVTVEGTLIAGNIAQGTITAYGAVPATTAALVNISQATGGLLAQISDVPLAAGSQSSVFLTDNPAAPNGFALGVLQDQQVAAATGHSAYRFLNQAVNTGPVDVYMIPGGTTVANAIPLITALPVGGTPTYINIISETVTLVITPTGVIKPSYTSPPTSLTGGEVRTVLILDSQLTSNPAVVLFTANDVN